MADPTFTPEQIAEDGRNRVGKTAAQAGVPAALIIIVIAALRGQGWFHGQLDTELTLAYQTILTATAAALSNIGRLRGKG